MQVVLFDNELLWKNLLPLTFTRPISEIRIGILTIKQKWDKYLNTNCAYATQALLSKKYSFNSVRESLFINSSVCPNQKLVDCIALLKSNQAVFKQDVLLAYKANEMDVTKVSTFDKIEFTNDVFSISNVWDVFQKNEDAIKNDFELITKNRKGQTLSSSVTVIGNRNLIFLEKGAKAEACILNTNSGPVYLGEDSEIMEGCIVRGALALCEHSTLKLGAKIYGATTVGPHCKVGGEINNSVIFGYTNKAHDGFLGNSVVGEWCNLGADTNTSNLKNNYATVKLFNYLQNTLTDTGLQFCGLIMGDHSKSGINTMFNTGTVVGVGANVFGGGFPPTFIPSFSWGGSEGFEKYRLDKFFETAARVFERRSLTISESEQEIISSIYIHTH